MLDSFGYKDQIDKFYNKKENSKGEIDNHMDIRFRDGKYEVYEIDDNDQDIIYSTFDPDTCGGLTGALALARAYMDGYQRGKSDWHG
jgi:hypothetical protein